MIGGSGGSGSNKGPLGISVGYDGTGLPSGSGGGGGGGAIMIAASNSIIVNGRIAARGGSSDSSNQGGGGGSGGAIRLITTTMAGTGELDCSGGVCHRSKYIGSPLFFTYTISDAASNGRVRIDALNTPFSGPVRGDETRGFQPIILPPANQAVSLAIQTVAGVAVALTPTGQLITPDVIVPANQQNPVPIVIRCTNIPLNTEIIVDVKPANGATVRSIGLNTVGNQASSIATVNVTMPRGGGTMQAKAISGLQLAANDDPNAEHHAIAKTGWTADGERFKAVEVIAGLGTASQLVYLTESGKRFSVASR